MVTCKFDRCDYVRDVGTPDNEPGSPVDHGIIQFTSLVVILITRLNQFATKVLGKSLNKFIEFHGIPLVSGVWTKPHFVSFAVQETADQMVLVINLNSVCDRYATRAEVAFGFAGVLNLNCNARVRRE